MAKKKKTTSEGRDCESKNTVNSKSVYFCEETKQNDSKIRNMTKSNGISFQANFSTVVVVSSDNNK